jgi:hypothetical protein
MITGTCLFSLSSLIESTSSVEPFDPEKPFSYENMPQPAIPSESMVISKYGESRGTPVRHPESKDENDEGQ